MTIHAAEPPASPFSEGIPSNRYSLKQPWTATLLENRRLTGESSPNDVRHLVLDLSGSELDYLAGQSLGILAPGLTASGQAHKLRLYSISTPSSGEAGYGKSASLSVKRVLYHDEQGNLVKGVCSNYLCDLAPGSRVQVTGPVGKAFLLPPDPTANFVFLATGTGVAPFRGFLHTLLDLSSYWRGRATLLFGAQYQADFLYQDELTQLVQDHPDALEVITAFSREEQTATGERCYIQHRLSEYQEKLVPMIHQPNTHVYLCGLKGMETGIIASLAQGFAAMGLSWDDTFAQMKQEKRWHVEVY